MHPAHNRIYLESLKIEIETLIWFLMKLVHNEIRA